MNRRLLRRVIGIAIGLVLGWMAASWMRSSNPPTPSDPPAAEQPETTRP